LCCIKAVSRLPERQHFQLSKLAALWFILAAVELSLNLVIPGSMLRNPELPLGARLLLFCYCLTLSALFLSVCTILLFPFSWLCERCLSGLRAKRVVSSGFGALATWIILLLYSASWGTFWQIGSFIDSRSFFFVETHPLQVFHWIDLDISLAVVASAGLGTLVVCRWVPRWVDRWKPETRIQLILTSTIAVGISVFGTYLGESYSGTEERRYMRSVLLYEKIQDNGVDPFAYVFTDLRKHLRPPAKQLKTNDVRIIQRPIISLEQYAALAKQKSSKRWNVIMLIVESMRADQLRVYGANRDVMPATNELASEARVFLNAYSQASHTDYATVTPFSSHFPLRSKTSYAYPEKLSYPRVLIYDVLKALGYHTAIFSSSNEYWSGM
jgi:glucan phosphoethanolaminetransferase (alkaline phosphatase superfamily)